MLSSHALLFDFSFINYMKGSLLRYINLKFFIMSHKNSSDLKFLKKDYLH